MLSKFIEELRQSKYYANIMGNHNVILLYVSGSRIIDITDERSDYDLVAVVDESVSVKTEEFLTYNGRKVHWYYIPLTEFIAGKGRDSLRGYGAVLFANVKDETVIYVAPSYESVCKMLIDNKEAIATNGCINVCMRYSCLIRSVVEAGEILPQHHTKILGHLCVTSLAVTGEKLTDETRDYVRQLKRIRWQPVSDEAKRWCVERLTMLKYAADTGNVNMAHSIN